MEGKGTNCTCKIVYSKALLIAGIVIGGLLGILGLITLVGDTRNLFADPFVMYFTTTVRKITFTDDKSFSSVAIWARPVDQLYFEWTSKSNKMVMETDAKYMRLPTGVRTKGTTNGKETIPLSNFTITDHYFCMTNDWGVTCDPRATYHLVVHMYKGTYFYSTPATYLGNQNMRWTFFILACMTIAFGVIMILGELHVPLVTTKFTFFYYSFVKGLVYVAFGFLVMGMANLLGLAMAVVMWALGILNCIYGWRSLATFQWNKVGARGTTTIVTRREYI